MVLDRYNVVPMFLAVLLHVLLAASMLLAFDFSGRKPPPMPLVIKGKLVADSTIVVPPPVEKPAPPEPVVDTAAVERARIAAEDEKRRQDAFVEKQRLEEMQRVKEAEAQRKREVEAKRQEEEEARRQREQEAELERNRQQAELERQQEIERQRLENERQRREAEAGVLSDAIAQEDFVPVLCRDLGAMRGMLRVGDRHLVGRKMDIEIGMLRHQQILDDGEIS